MPNIGITGFSDIHSPEALALRTRVDAALIAAGDIALICQTTLIASENKKCTEAASCGPRIEVRALSQEETDLEEEEKNASLVVVALKAANIRISVSVSLSVEYYHAHQMVADKEPAT